MGQVQYAVITTDCERHRVQDREFTRSDAIDSTCSLDMEIAGACCPTFDAPTSHTHPARAEYWSELRSAHAPWP